MRGTMGFFLMTHRRYDVTFQMWNQFLCYHRVRSGGGILCLSIPSLWHRGLPDTKIWHAVRRFFTDIQKTFVAVANWKLCKDWWYNAHSSIFALINFGIDGFAFRRFPCRHHADESLGESGKAVFKFSSCWYCRLTMEQHWPLLIIQSFQR